MRRSQTEYGDTLVNDIVNWSVSFANVSIVFSSCDLVNAVVGVSLIQSQLGDATEL